MLTQFARRLLKWYAAHQRALPWRGARNPYHVWVSEVMLQQTQVETVKPYYSRWLERFPTVEALAAAPQKEVLALWEGLGYYARARNFHRAAQSVMADYSGRIPDHVEELLKLPGVGRYTAGAIASIAFNVDAAVLDGNVQRVLARVFDYREDVKSPRGEKDLWKLAESLVPPGRAGDYNQALMDLGATLCTPRAPACSRCPLSGMCQARQLGVQAARPVTKKRAALPHYTLAAGVIRKNGRVLIVQRSADELLGGLWMFPNARVSPRKKLSTELRRHVRAGLGLKVRVGPPVQILRHAYTHFRVTVHVFECDWLAGDVSVARRRGERVKWVHASSLPTYPMGKTDRRIAQPLSSARSDRSLEPR
jgi:A/G-specific adenine glycosylase